MRLVKTIKAITIFSMGVIFLSFVIGIKSEAIYAQSPPNGADGELDLMKLTGIWKGAPTILDNFNLYQSIYELRLRHSGNSILGEGSMKYRDGELKVDVIGSFDGTTFKGNSSNYRLIHPYTKDKANIVFKDCRNFTYDFKFNRIVGVSDNYSLAEVQAGYPKVYTGDILYGYLTKDEGKCVDASHGVSLLRTSEVIVVMFGGFGDENEKNRAVIDYTYPPYVKRLNETGNYGQYVKYFAYDRVKEAKRFIYEKLRASPEAKVALVGHSLGGDATFRLAKLLETELPQLKIDLVVTLDPVTLIQNPGIQRKGLPPSKKIDDSIPVRPVNISEWINVHVKLTSGLADTIVSSAGRQWKEQPTANYNIFSSVTHPQAHQMFYTEYNQLGNSSPASKLESLSGLSTRTINTAFRQKVELLYSQSDTLLGDAGTDDLSSKNTRTESVTVQNRLLSSVKVKRGNTINIESSGRIVLGFLAGASDPNGIAGFQSYSFFPEAPHGSLLVRVSNRGDEDWTICGTRCSIKAGIDGSLEFLVNDRDYQNNSGQYQISVLIK